MLQIIAGTLKWKKGMVPRTMRLPGYTSMPANLIEDCWTFMKLCVRTRRCVMIANCCVIIGMAVYH